MRLDFIEHPSETGYMVVLNGRPIPERFAHVREVLALAQAMGTSARYSGKDVSRIVAEGGRLQADEENVVL
jgi:hypothetical protein